MKYRKKPVVIEAFQLNTIADAEAQLSKWGVKVKLAHLPPSASAVRNHGVIAVRGHRDLYVATSEGVMLAQPGDWIIRGVEGELYPCKDSVFQASYEAAE